MLLFCSPGDQGKGRQPPGSDCFKFGEGAGVLGMRSCGMRCVCGLSTLQRRFLGLVWGALHPMPAPLRLSKSRVPARGNATGRQYVSKFLAAANLGDLGVRNWKSENSWKFLKL